MSSSNSTSNSTPNSLKTQKSVSFVPEAPKSRRHKLCTKTTKAATSLHKTAKNFHAHFLDLCLRHRPGLERTRPRNPYTCPECSQYNPRFWKPTRSCGHGMCCRCMNLRMLDGIFCCKTCGEPRQLGLPCSRVTDCWVDVRGRSQASHGPHCGCLDLWDEVPLRAPAAAGFF